MKTKDISVEDLFKEWNKEPEFVAAYDALEEEFARASSKIKTQPNTEASKVPRKR